MIYLFPPEITTIFGLVLIGWFVWALLSSVVKGADKNEVPKQSITLSATQSVNGKTHIEKACYYPSMKSYYAKVVCQELEYSWNVWADSKEDMEHKVKEEFDRCDEKIRERINKREMKKPLYFRIG